MKCKIITLLLALLRPITVAAQTEEPNALTADIALTAENTETAVSDTDTTDTDSPAAVDMPPATADMPPAAFAKGSSPAQPMVSTESFQFKETGPLISLEQAHQMAKNNHPTFKNLDEQIHLANTQIQAAWAMLLPHIGTEARIIRNHKEVVMPLPDFENIDIAALMAGEQMEMNEIELQKKWQPTLGLGANITLFNARSLPLIKYAYDMVEQAKLKAQIARNDLLFAVTSSYCQIANLKELVYVCADNVNVAKKTLRMAEARIEAGQEAAIDVLRLQIQVEDKERTLADAVDAYYTAKTSLALFIGAKGEFQIVMPRQIADPKKSETALANEALKKRIELKSAELDVTMARRLAKETRNKWLPQFYATWKMDVTSAEGLSGEKADWMLIFTMRWSILEGGSRIAEKKKRAAEIRIAENKIDEIKIGIQTDVANKMKGKISSERNLKVAAKLVSLAEKKYNMIAWQYEGGMTNSLELTDAANELTKQKVMLVLAKLQHELALLTLAKTVGEYSSLAFE